VVAVGINGFGRIGRIAFRAALELEGIEVVAVNDLMPAETLAFLLKYDTVHGKLDCDVRASSNKMVVDGREVVVFNERDPAQIPWGELGVEVVIESSGVFRTRDKASLHLRDTVKKVLVSAPMPDPDITILPGINVDKYDRGRHHVISMASCTTNALAPLIKVLKESFGIAKGEMTTIHAYTNDQRLLDAIHRDIRRARAAALNLIPTSTGAAQAIFQIYPDLKGKLTALAVRGLLTTVTDGNLVKVLAWYDNEYGYAYHLARLAARLL